MTQLRQGAPSPEFASAVDLRRHYAGVHSRLFQARPGAPITSAPPVRPLPFEPRQPDPVRAIKDPVAARRFQGRIAEIVTAMAHENHVTREAILGGSLRPEDIEARFDAIVAIRMEYPNLSLHRIGKALGKDHSSIQNALVKRGVMRTKASATAGAL